MTVTRTPLTDWVYLPDPHLDSQSDKELHQSHYEQVYHSLVQEYGGEESETLAWDLTNRTIDPSELTDVFETASPYLTTQNLHTYNSNISPGELA